MKLEDLTPGARVNGLITDRTITVVSAHWHGNQSITLTHRDDQGNVGEELLFRDDEPRLEILESGRAWSFDANGGHFRLVSEALRIRLAHLFDPYLAVHTSNLDPLPHQIRAVYGEMLPRMPLRFLLADDPGAGKTIMAGLLIKELMVRGDLKRCMIVAPGGLVEQWQDELAQKLGLDFDIITRESIEASRTGNPFAEKNLIIARLDQLSRNEDVQEKLVQTDWDLIVVDEAHKMSARFYGNEVKKTGRYNLGEKLGQITRHLVLMTATPHSGKQEDFQLFMALVDPDRFEGKPREDGETTDAQGLMRRMVKEELLTFEGKPLFPERRAYTVGFELSAEESNLYTEVTDYVRNEMNRAEKLEGKRGNVLGFALTVLQRRLASSPEAIYQSLRRRGERLQFNLNEAKIGRKAEQSKLDLLGEFDAPDDPDELLDGELEDLEEAIVDNASAAATIEELEAEIIILKGLEELADRVRKSGRDAKWARLAELLQDEQEEMFDAAGKRRKLIIFSEHRDTLNYLTEKIRTLLGRPEAVVEIHGGMRRELRRAAQESFRQDPDVSVMVATDAAGEGFNLQCAHLLINYDLPWNPNRIEQRFGRIHRIGQTEVCHMWNLVATETREGDVFKRLLEKLNEACEDLGGRVFDVLGDDLFEGEPLRDLLIEAVRYGDQPEIRAQLNKVVDKAIGEKLREALNERALLTEMMSATDVEKIRAQMEEAEVRKLQPFYIRSFFMEAFRLLGGKITERELGRYEITNVPAEIRNRGSVIGAGIPIVQKYSRVTFEKSLVAPSGGEAPAQLLAPGHPLLDATVDLTIERYRPLLKQGAILVDEQDEGETPRALVYLEHSIQNGREVSPGKRQLVSRRLQFVELDRDGNASHGGHAPYLDYRSIEPEERDLLRDLLDQDVLAAGVETVGVDWAIENCVPEHLGEVRDATLDRVAHTKEAVHKRLTHEIQHWDHRATELDLQVQAGKQPKMNPDRARQRANELQARLKARTTELEQEAQLSPLPPLVVGGALVVPRGLLERLEGGRTDEPAVYAEARKRVERVAVDAVMAAERALGREPLEMPPNNKGYDIQSRRQGEPLLFIEVKGRAVGAETFTITKNEVLHALNKGDDFILALVSVDGDKAAGVSYIRQPFSGSDEVLFAMTSMNQDWNLRFEQGGAPS